jgi:threonine synthase
MTICERRPGEAGDPCFLRFREAVERGAIPFGVQGTENGLAIESGRTLALEMAQGFGSAAMTPDMLFVQVGGGALASAMAQGFALARDLGFLSRLPKLMAVQTARCAPLARAWQRLDALDLAQAARQRSRFMWPWETEPVSLASGILDDETYDWWAIVEGMRASGGAPVIVDEDVLAAARDAAQLHTGIRVSATGASGLAGAMAHPAAGGDIAVIFSGVER